MVNFFSYYYCRKKLYLSTFFHVPNIIRKLVILFLGHLEVDKNSIMILETFVLIIIVATAGGMTCKNNPCMYGVCQDVENG